MKYRLAAIAVLLAAANVAFAADTNYSVRLDCELQTAGPASLRDVNWTQGQTPLMELRVLRNGRPVAADTNTSVRMLFAASSTATTYAVATNYWPSTNAASYYVQWGAVGTNTAGTGTTAQAWFYTVYFDKISTGETYWSGSGALYVEKSTSLADGLDWIAATNLPRVAWPNVLGDPADNEALAAYIAESAGEDSVARAGVESNAASIVAVGAVASNALPKSGGTMTGNINIGGNVISNLSIENNVGMFNGNFLLETGNIGVWDGGNPEIRIGVTSEAGSTNDASFAAFETLAGIGALQFRNMGVAGEFWLTEGGAELPWGGGYSLMPLHANVECDWIVLGTNQAISNWPSASGIDSATAWQIASNVVGHGLSDYFPVTYATSISINPTNGYKQGLFLAGTSIVSIAGGNTNQMGDVRLDVWTGANQHLFTNPVPAGTWSTTTVNTVIYSKPAHSAAWTARVFQW